MLFLGCLHCLKPTPGPRGQNSSSIYNFIYIFMEFLSRLWLFFCFFAFWGSVGTLAPSFGGRGPILGIAFGTFFFFPENIIKNIGKIKKNQGKIGKKIQNFWKFWKKIGGGGPKGGPTPIFFKIFNFFVFPSLIFLSFSIIFPYFSYIFLYFPIFSYIFLLLLLLVLVQTTEIRVQTTEIRVQTTCTEISSKYPDISFKYRKI